MPIHDWTRVPAGIFHHFHHAWIEEIARVLNRGLMPPDYYALAEQAAAGFGPDVLTLQARAPESDPGNGSAGPVATLTLTHPRATITITSDTEFSYRKKSVVAVRHVSDDRVVAVVEIISPGNKSSRNTFRALVEKACRLLSGGVHLLLLDLFPPTPRDPHGLHAAIWAEIEGETAFTLPPDKPLTLVAYESADTVTAYIEPVAVGDGLPDMPLILEPGGAVMVPLEATYQTAWNFTPMRWRDVLAPRPVSPIPPTTDPNATRPDSAIE